MLLPKQDDNLFNRRLSKAGSSLVIHLPFFGYLLFGSGIKVICEESIDTMATDGINVYVGYQFVMMEDTEILMFGLLHEVLHIYFSHASRQGDRDEKVWGTAIDIYTNGQCSELLGTQMPTGLQKWKVPDRFIQPQAWADGKTVEQIYDLLITMKKQDPDALKKLHPQADRMGSGNDLIKTPKGSEDPQSNTEWQEIFRNDVAHAKVLSENNVLQLPMSSEVKSRMDKILRPTLPWGSLLRGTLSQDLGFDEMTYCPPKMRYYPIILPQLRSTKERTLVILVDVSASVTQELINIFITNVQAAAHRATKTVIVTFDQIVREHYEVKHPRYIFSKVKFMSGAHSYTSAVDAFRIAKEAKPSSVACLTDGHIELPDYVVPHTTFIIPEGGKQQPWGKHYIMEHPWR